MTVKLPISFEDQKIWVEIQTWTALVGSVSTVPVTSLFQAADEALEKGGALVIYEDEGNIINHCNRADELQTLKDLVAETRRQSNLPPL
jgi:hypothetical protein